MKRRVVVTGIGMVTPLGNTCQLSWDALKRGKSGVSTVSHYNTQDNPTKIAATVSNFDPSQWIDRKDLKKIDKLTVLLTQIVNV